MKIAVVGAGIFGVSTALELSRAGYEVDLLEQYDDILQAASGINQYRLHRGYHYPRSPETIKESYEAEPLFLDEYGAAVNKTNRHYYCLAKEGSLVDCEQFLNLCRQYDLENKICRPQLVDHTHLQLTVKVREYLIDITALRRLCWKKLRQSRVRVLLGTEAGRARRLLITS